MNLSDLSILTDCAAEILRAAPHGILLASAAGERRNVMTIGWLSLGNPWAVPTVTVFIREGRYTRTLLDENPEFTLNVPPYPHDKNILRVCGTVCGRDADKIALAGLRPLAAETVTPPVFAGSALALECRIVHRAELTADSVPPAFRHFYPPEIPGTDCGRNRDGHIVYTGEILRCRRPPEK